MKKRLITALGFALSLHAAHAQWTTVCGTGNGFVDNFEVFGNELYATGFFTSLCGTANNHIVKLNGVSWQPAGNGYAHAGHQLKSIGGSLYFVGYQPNIDSNWVYRFDGTNFNKVGEGVYLTTAVTGGSETANLYAMLPYGGKIIASGEFDRVGNRAISGIMQWDGTAWDSLGSGLSGNIAGGPPVMYPHDLCTFGPDLVVAGNFLKAGGVTTNGIARWDGTQWHSMGAGFNAPVYGICEFNGELYAGGEFTMSGSTPLKCIARWDGTDWVSPGFQLYYNNPLYHPFVHTLKVIGPKMYIGGGFDRIASGTGVHQGQAICAFDGTAVDTLHGGVTNREVEGIAFYNNELYAGGGINNSNSFIAKYVSTAGLEKPEKQPSWTVSPNPAGSTLTISGSQAGIPISVFSPDGKQCLVLTASGPETAIDISSLKPGVYLVEMNGRQQRVLKK